MKIQTKIWILGIFLALNACQPYSEEDVAYFETSLPYLLQGKHNMERESQGMLRDLEDESSKQRTNNQVENYLKQAHELVKATAKVNTYFEVYEVLGISEYDLRESEERAYLKANHSNLYIKNNKVTEIDSVIHAYISFIEEKYPKFMTAKLKTWKREKEGILRRKCKNLPLVGAWAKLVDIQIQLILQEHLILNDLLAKAEKTKSKRKYTEHLHWVFSEEKNKVKLGEEYKATLFLAIAYQMPDMEMEINGQKIPVKDGIGKIRFKAKGIGKKYWKGKVTFKDPATGRDTTFTSETMMYEVIPKQE